MEAYISDTELKSTLTLTGQTYADADIQAALFAASAGIDNLCHRVGTTSRLGFQQDADANQVRYYDATNQRRLEIDDLTTLTSLLVDSAGDGSFSDTWTVNTDFVLEPLNAATIGWPYTSVCVKPTTGSFLFPVGYVRSVKVTGKFGWPNVPDAIVQATTILASKLVKRAREVPFGVIAVNMDGAAIRLAKSDPDIQFLVGPYIKHRIAVG